MNTPDPIPSLPEVLTSSTVLQTYGEPRFHTEGDIAAVAYLADGTLYSIDDAGILRHWSGDGKLLKRSYLSDLETLWAFAPFGVKLASGNDDLLIWETATGQLAHRIVLKSWLTTLAFNADAAQLAVGHDDGTISLWDANTLNPIKTLSAKTTAVAALAFSPDSKFLASSAEDRIVRIWDVATGQEVYQGRSHTDRVPSLSWAPDGSLLVSAGWDTSARVWRPTETDPVILLNSHAEQVHLVAFHPTDAKVLATADSDYDIYLWADATYGKVGHILRGHVDEIRSLSFNADGSRLASAGADRVVHIWDTATGRLLAGPNPKGKHAVAVFEHAGRLRLASTGGPSFRLWDVETGDEVEQTDDFPAYSVAAAPDGSLLAAGGTDHVTRLYDLTKPGTPPRLLEATKPPIGSIAVGPKGDLVAHTSPADGLVWIWTTTSDEAMLILIEAADGCTLEGVAFHPDGKRVVVGGIDYLSTGERDGAVCVWDLATKEKTATFDYGVYAVTVDDGGRYVAGAGLSERVYLWDLTLDSEEPVFALEGHTDRIQAVCFSTDGSYLVSTSDDQTLRIWDVLSGRLLAMREFDAPIQSLAFSPDGQWLFTGNADTTIHRLDFAKLLDD